MGAMKSGGQGSVYKGRRIGEIITAVKLLPTPIFNENYDDKNYRDFQNEVQKLKKVNEKPNPNIVKILSSGLSETGNFPFIEMEFIEGPDLEDLLKPPNDPVFTVKEVIKVAEHLSNALAHCHRLDVKHGDIKSNNVKLNINTRNYILLDFGLAAMSDEQRRTSLRQAGAVEFMAPEQNEGELLFQTDVYSFGVILFELLAGSVPFPLNGKGESARNHIRLAHMEKIPPDIVAMRKQALPQAWSADKKNRELVIPDWLIKMVYRCLKKSPENRFSNGMDLQNYIVYNSTHALPKETVVSNAPPSNAEIVEKQQLQQQLLQYRRQLELKQKELEDLKAKEQQQPLRPQPEKVAANASANAAEFVEKQQLQQQILQYRRQLELKQKELEDLKTEGQQRTFTPQPEKVTGPRTTVNKKRISAPFFFILILLAIALATYAAYSFFKDNSPRAVAVSKNTLSKNASVRSTSERNTSVKNTPVETPPAATPVLRKENKKKKAVAVTSSIPEEVNGGSEQSSVENQKPAPGNISYSNEYANNDERYGGTANNETKTNNPGTVKYTVNSIAHFYNAPDDGSQRPAFINHWNRSVLIPQDEQNGFIYVVYKNDKGQTSKGWMRKSDLRPLNK